MSENTKNSLAETDTPKLCINCCNGSTFEESYEWIRTRCKIDGKCRSPFTTACANYNKEVATDEP